MTSREEQEALLLLNEFRASHSRPLLKATMGLRSMIRTEGCAVEVAQRLKRRNAILSKLVREPAMALTKMQDIGGCRAILDSVDELRRVETRLRQKRRPLRVYDYVQRPRPSGYRGVHVIVEYDGCPIEVQLRSRRMQDWAEFVEELDGQFGQDVKNGNGPQLVHDWLNLVSMAMAIEDSGGTVETQVVDRINAMRQDVVTLLSL